MRTNQQQQAYDKFVKLKVGALFMEMGTGKTKVALDLVNYNNVDLLVYVTPFSSIQNIKNEIDKWGINCDYIVVGYETISSSDSKFIKLLKNLDNKKCFIIADESIFIKNEETKRFKRLIQLRNKCEYALILNGTPLTKNEWDLYNQMYFLSPKIINMNRDQFLGTFFKHIIYKKSGEKEHDFYKFSEVNADALSKMIEPYIFKCRLDFHQREKTEYKWVDYTDERDYYDEKERKLKEYMETYDSDVIISMLQSLNSIASKYNKKNNELIKYIKNKRAIVFCNYLDEVEYIASKIECYVITGNIKNRNLIIKDFEKDNKPLIMTFGVGSYSLNLQFCNEIVYSSINFDYAKLEQSKYRIKRLGQESDIKYTYFLTNLGINKFILENLNKKLTLNNLVKEKFKESDIKWLKQL